MSEVKWIKIVTDIFDDEKMLLIESLPSPDSLIVIWFKLLCLAGKNNNNGVFLLNDKIPYTDEMLATIFRRDVNTVRLALNTFEEFGMIEIIEGVITIPNWGKHQSLDMLENKKNYMRNYMRNYREKQKKMIGVSKYNEQGLNAESWKAVLEEFNYECAYCGSKEELEQDHVVPVAQYGMYSVGNIVPACRRCNASKKDNEVLSWYEQQPFYSEERCKYLRKYLHKPNVSEAELDKEEKDKKDIDIEILSNTKVFDCPSLQDELEQKYTLKEYVDLWNTLSEFGISKCQRIPVGNSRAAMLKKRLKEYGEDSFSKVIEEIKNSDFLQGKISSPGRNPFNLNFGWAIKPENYRNILEGKYKNRGNNTHTSGVASIKLRDEK